MADEHPPADDVSEEKTAELRAAVAAAQARSNAMLKAIPDLMFVLERDGTFVDFHARDPKTLFVPPSVFVGRNVRDIFPRALAEQLIDALERACQTDEPVIVEYALPMGEERYFEARIVQLDGKRLLTIVRDITDARRASELNRELARRLIARQEIERQRIARELHDDISQRLALLNITIDEIAAGVGEPTRARLRRLTNDTAEIAGAVHGMAYDLHPYKLQLLGLVAAMQSLCESVSEGSDDLRVTFLHAHIPASLDAKVSLSLYRITQEALHNVLRHSHARDARVCLTCDADYIVLRVTDSGVGFDPRRVPDAGLGLVSMEERAALLKGQLTIETVPGEGTQVYVRVPLLPEEAEAGLPDDQHLSRYDQV